MKKFLMVLCALPFAFINVAQADVWKWVDADGNTHFVDTLTSIFTWVDEQGDVHYSDTPDHEDAVAVQLVWVSSGSLETAQKTAESTGEDAGSGPAFPGETAAQKAEREQAEAYYCKRATEIYDSYVNAPRLYKTNEEGEREYLDEKEMAKMIEETRAKKEEICG